MSNQKIENKRIILILFLFLIVGIAGITIAFVRVEKNTFAARLGIDKQKTTTKTSSINSEAKVEELWSQGNQVLIAAKNNINKLEGIRAYSRENYKQAQAKFMISLENDSNDPETLIYLNNSKAVVQGNEVTIAVSVPIGGNLNVAQEILRGVAQAQNQFNSNQENKNRLLKVIIANDNNNPELAQEIATKFVQEEEIIAVVGHNASDSSIAAAPIYQEGGLVMITPTSSAKSLTEIGNYIYRTTPSTRALADKLAGYIVNTARKTNITICADEQAKASVSFKNDLTWAVYQYGGVVNGVKCNFSAMDFNPTKVPPQAISNGADALVLAPSLRYLDQAIEVARANQQQLPLFGSHTVFKYNTLKQGQMSVNGLVLPVAWYPKSSENSSFVENAQKLWKETGSWRTAMAYDATQVIIQALQSTDSSRQQIQKVIDNPEFVAQGSSESIRFMQNGDRLARGVLVRVEPGERSGTGYDFAYLESN
ncbi:ABC transporter substrate-binding protein [Hyella patelloides]|nr:ABC transporter substrate-binding protein [Hyella patelloides]